MKKFLVLSSFGILGVVALLINVSCTTSTPTSTNFQNPIQTIAAINPTLTATPFPTATPIPTATFTPGPHPSGITVNGLNNPQAVAVYNNSTNGGFFVADTGNNLIKKYNFNGTLAAGWGNGGKGKGKIAFNNPLGLAVDGSGNLYVVGGVNGVYKYDSLGNLINQINNSFTNPRGVAVDGSGNLYVSDTANSRIVQLQANGNPGTGLVGGTGIVTLTTPITAVYGLAVDNTNTYVFVADHDNSSVTYNTVSQITISNGTINPITGFNQPNAVAFDSNNNLYVTDSGSSVELFSSGNFVAPVFIYGVGTLSFPTGVAVDNNGNVYVADSNLNEVIVFAP